MVDSLSQESLSLTYTYAHTHTTEAQCSAVQVIDGWEAWSQERESHMTMKRELDALSLISSFSPITSRKLGIIPKAIDSFPKPKR